MSTSACVEGFAVAHPHVESEIKPLCYTVKDTCRLLSISRSHLYDLYAHGQLRFVKIGSRTLVPATEIARLSGMEAA
jgi:excisionase family DNA binding protein